MIEGLGGDRFILEWLLANVPPHCCVETAWCNESRAERPKAGNGKRRKLSCSVPWHDRTLKQQKGS